jgi:hypothetical protein
MSAPIPLNLVVEDFLSESVVLKILHESGRPFAVGTRYLGRQGAGYIKKRISGFNQAAKATPFLILTDLDDEMCAPQLLQSWLSEPPSRNLIFRIAVREVEAWLLAHRDGIATFLGIQRDLIPSNVESLGNPKEVLIGLARKSRRGDIRKDIVPPDGSNRVQGPDYNGRLIRFVEESWSPARAMENSQSLSSAAKALASFKPTWSLHP